MDDWQSGDPLTADRLNRHAEDVRRAGGVPGGTGGDGFATSAGVSYGARPPGEFWIALGAEGAAGAYAWTEQVPDDEGTWIDGARSGTAAEDPAVELNATTGLIPGTRALARRPPGSRRLIFQAGACD